MAKKVKINGVKLQTYGKVSKPSKPKKEKKDRVGFGEALKRGGGKMWKGAKSVGKTYWKYSSPEAETKRLRSQIKVEKERAKLAKLRKQSGGNGMGFGMQMGDPFQSMGLGTDKKSKKKNDNYFGW